MNQYGITKNNFVLINFLQLLFAFIILFFKKGLNICL